MSRVHNVNNNETQFNSNLMFRKQNDRIILFTKFFLFSETTLFLLNKQICGIVHGLFVHYSILEGV